MTHFDKAGTMLWQETLTEYINAEFQFSAGDYGAALALLQSTEQALPPPDPSARGFHTSFRQVIEIAKPLNGAMLGTRFARSGPDEHRYPRATGDVIKRGGKNAFSRVHDFYAVARDAFEPTIEARKDPDLWLIRNAMLGDDAEDQSVAARMRLRYEHRQRFAQATLGTTPRNDPPALDTINAFVHAGFDEHDSTPAFVLEAFFQAHVNRYNVDHARSVSIGRLLERSSKDHETDTETLEQSVAPFTFSYVICGALPWLFAEDESERSTITKDPTLARGELSKPSVWLTRQMVLLSIYRRARVFRLLGEHERSYNDLRKVQRISRRTRLGIPVGDPQRANLNTIEALAEFRIGELYRADHDASQALVHLCRSHDLVAPPQDAEGVVARSALFELHISLGKGKAFFEGGAMKRALKWFLRAWTPLRNLAGLAAPTASCQGLDDHLERMKHAPEFDKNTLLQYLPSAVDEICTTPLGEQGTHDALAADILVRCARAARAQARSQRGTLAGG